MVVEKIKMLYGNRRVKEKIILNYLLVIVVTIVSLSTIVTSVSIAYLTRSTEESTRQLIAQVDSNINLYINNISDIITYFAQEDAVIEFLNGEDSIENTNRVIDVLKQMENSKEEIAGMMIVNESGEYISNSMKEGIRNSLTSESWYIQAKENPGVQLISNPMGRNAIYKDNLFSTEDVVSICRAVHDNNNKFIGVILIDFKLEIFEDIIEETEIGRDGFVYIQDQEGNIVYSPVNEIVYRIKPEWLNDNQKMLEAKVGGKEYKILWMDSKYTGWKVAGVFSLDEMYAQIRDIVLLVIMISFAIVLLSLWFSSILANSITKPLAKLEKLMKKSEAGELDVSFEIKYNDEIGRLGGSFNKMIKSVNNLIDLVYEEQHKKREAELEIFRSQIKPHFLYNTLDTIHWLIKERKDEKALEALRALTNLFRISLSKGADVITLQDEIKHVESYLVIQKVRYEEKFKYNIECPNDLIGFDVSKITLQPIVENAIYHGIKEKRGMGTININVSKQNNVLIFIIEDDGIGIENNKLVRLQKVLSGEIERSDEYGLINVNERIKLMYGDEYGVSIESKYGIGTKVIIKHPII